MNYKVTGREFPSGKRFKLLTPNYWFAMNVNLHDGSVWRWSKEKNRWTLLVRVCCSVRILDRRQEVAS